MTRARPEWQQEWTPGLWLDKLAQCFAPQAKQPICLYLIYSGHSWWKDTKLEMALATSTACTENGHGRNKDSRVKYTQFKLWSVNSGKGER